MKIKFSKNPELDFFSLIVGPTVPTKQDWFEEDTRDFYIKDGGVYKIPKDTKFYIKRENSSSYKAFKKMLTEEVKKSISDDDFPIDQENSVEVIIHVTMKDHNRLNTVDVDNLAKGVLDALNGNVYVDDSQVHNLLVSKSIHELADSLMLGVRIISEENSWFNDIMLAELEEEESTEKDT